MGRRGAGARWVLGLLLLGLLAAAAAQAHSAPDPAAASEVNATLEAAAHEEEADDAGGHVASEGVCVSPTPASPTQLQCNETSEGVAEEEAAPVPAAADAGVITPPASPQWEPALAANDTAPASNDTAAGGEVAEEESEQHNFALEKDGAWLPASPRFSTPCPALPGLLPTPCHARHPPLPCPQAPR